MERTLCGRLIKAATQSGKPVVEIFAADTRLEYPILRAFDLTAVEALGLDPNALTTEPTHLRFWAYWTESDKLNAQGNPYKDLEYLELVDTPASATSVDSSATLAELRKISALLNAIALRLQIDTQTGEIPPADPSLLAYANGDLVGANTREQMTFIDYLAAHQSPPTDRDALRSWLLAQD